CLGGHGDGRMEGRALRRSDLHGPTQHHGRVRGRAAQLARVEPQHEGSTPCGLPRLNCRVAALPTGTVTLLFTDIEGSTKLLQRLGTDAYTDALAEHRRVLREAFTRHDGVEVDTQGDSFFVAFFTAP